MRRVLFGLALALWALAAQAQPAWQQLLLSGNTITALNGLVGYWPLDEGGGSVAFDYSGNGNNGTLVNSPTWTTGQIKGALSFNGTNQYINLGKANTFNLNQDLTISAWIKLPTVPVGGSAPVIIGDISSNGQNTQYNLRVSFANTGDIMFGWGVPSHDRIWTTAGGVISAGSWYHVVMTRVGTGTPSDVVTIYVNGFSKALASTGDASTAPAFSNVGNTSIGRNGDGSGYFPGTIDDPRIYNRVISAAEVAQIYNAGLGGHAANDNEPQAPRRFAANDNLKLPPQLYVVARGD